jgi:polyribonucleotide nucleotidyltransferase
LPKGIFVLNPIKKSFAYGDHTVTLETAEIARQAGGAVMVTMDDTVVLATVVGARRRQARAGFLPADRRLQERPTLPVASRAASSSAKAVRRKRKR